MMLPTSLKKIFALDQLLVWLFLGCLVFIPLYPKIPLFSPIEEYIVRVRLEDLLVLVTGGVWLWYWIKKRITVSHQLLFLIGLYIFVGGISLLSAIYVLGSIPQQPIHMGKSVLHWFRYIEYLSLGVIGYSVIKQYKRVELIPKLLVAITLITAVYGIGQRYAQFPVYSTMNREYSKGVQLMLDSPYARVPSTFAGHYDFGAYLVLVLPIVLALFWLEKNYRLRLLYGIGFLFGVWSMLASSSRSSFIGFIGAVSLVSLLVAITKKRWKRRLQSFITTISSTYGIIFVMIIFFGGNLLQLFLTNVQEVPFLEKPYQLVTRVIPQLEKIDGAVVQQYTNPIPKNQEDEQVVDETERPPDVYVDVPDKVEVVTIDEEGNREVSIEERPRTFSECAQTRGLSLCIRLEALWPQALNGFYTNPLLGTGYATLNKQTKWHFTEADGTDNNYLRILGETGVLGFITFFSVLGYVVWQVGMQVKRTVSSNKPKISSTQLALLIGYLAGLAGLLVNAIYIDVFAASKVAFTLWALTGVVLALVDNYLDKGTKVN